LTAEALPDFPAALPRALSVHLTTNRAQVAPVYIQLDPVQGQLFSERAPVNSVRALMDSERAPVDAVQALLDTK